MNRSILIVICDFLLVSLLVFSTPDINRLANPSNEAESRPLIITNRSDARQDLAAVMRLALEEERKGREQLQGQLTQNSQQLQQQQALLSEREKQVQISQQEKSNLEQQFAATQTNLQTLNQQLQATRTDALASKDRALSVEAALRHQEELERALRQRVAQLAQSNQTVLSEKQQLATQLQVTEAEKRAANQQLARAQDEVKLERQEKARLTEHAEKLADNVKTLANKSGELAEGVKTLSARSSDLTQEIREHRPLAANTVFNEFTTNRVHATFFGSRGGIFGIDTNKRRETEMVLIADGTNAFAVCHVAETPVVFTPPGNGWASLVGSLSRKQAVLPISSISFSSLDPRIVLIPVTAAQVRELDCRVYRTSNDPFKFQDAIVIGATEGYYGECKFQIDVSAPYYVKMDRSFLKGIFGKFNPSRGDLVFSKSGELLGIMANSTYCVMLQNLEAAATLKTGENIRDQHTESVLSSLNQILTNLPIRLQ
jgi:X-X-X-Leu-X-X-Gly heptad repeat protein